MGAILGTCHMASTVAVECETPAHIFWNLMKDFASLEKFVSVVKSVQVLDEGKPFQVGTRWIETRLYDGVEIVVHKTVTLLDEENFSWTVGAEFAPNSRDLRNAFSTGTIKVDPVTETSCRITATWAFLGSNNPCSTLFFFCCRPCIERKSMQFFHAEIDEAVSEAERRYSKELQGNKTGQ